MSKERSLGVRIAIIDEKHNVVHHNVNDAVKLSSKDAVARVLTFALDTIESQLTQHEAEYAIETSRRMTDEEIVAAIQANKASWARRLRYERVKIFNEHNLVPVGSSDPFEVFEAADEAARFLAGLSLTGDDAKKQRALVEKLMDVLVPGNREVLG